MIDVIQIADHADMIINGYAFTREDKNIKVLNLNNPIKSAFMNCEGKVLETSMDDIEIDIVKDYLENNREFMED